MTIFKTDDNTKVEVEIEAARGTTLYVGSRSIRIMFSVWDTEQFAKYWDRDAQKVVDVSLSYGGHEMIRPGTATVDVTDDVWAEVYKSLLPAFSEIIARDMVTAIRERPIEKGEVVRVIGGRTGKGVVGPVVIAMDAVYKQGWKSNMERKFAIATSDRKGTAIGKNGRVYTDSYLDLVWVWSRNVERASDIPHPDLADVAQRAEARALSHMKAMGFRG